MASKAPPPPPPAQGGTKVKETSPPPEAKQKQSQGEEKKDEGQANPDTQLDSNSNGSGKFSGLGFKKPEPQKRGKAIVLYAVEKWGKTTFGAYAPNAGIVMAPRETGYYTLLEYGLVPEVPAIEVGNFEQLMYFARSCQNVGKDDLPENLIFDAIGGFEQLCWEYVCSRDYNNDWSKKGFWSFQEGPKVSQNDWILWLNELTRITNRGTNVIILGHSVTATFQNPEGADFTRYACDVHGRTWSPMHRWADAILFGNYLTVTTEKDPEKKGKGLGQDKRVVYTKRRDAWDAGNRFSMPERIDLPNDPSKNWQTIMQHIIK